jgi:hypothetical protein
MSIYKPTLLDKFKDFVNGLKSNWDAYEGHVEDFETAKGIITDTFDETRTYAVGDYAIYENVLYKCVEAIEEAGEWDADKWAATNIAEEFKSHQAESASKHITESGSNDDGYYIKFDDGTMICCHTTTITYAHSYECLTTWIYPQPFLQGSAISRLCTHSNESNVQRYQVTGVRISGQTNQPHVGALVRALSYGGHFTSDSSVSVNVFAMGRWK